MGKYDAECRRVVDGGPCPPSRASVWLTGYCCVSKFDDWLELSAVFGSLRRGGRVGTQEITGLVVLLDGVSPEPVLDAGVIVVQSPEGLGI